MDIIAWIILVTASLSVLFAPYLVNQPTDRTPTYVTLNTIGNVLVAILAVAWLWFK